MTRRMRHGSYMLHASNPLSNAEWDHVKNYMAGSDNLERGWVIVSRAVNANIFVTAPGENWRTLFAGFWHKEERR